jgi:hypothetical protein
MRLAAMILAAAIALGGCGGSGEQGSSTGSGGSSVPKGEWGPTEPGTGERKRPVAPPRKAPPAAVAQLLEAGTVGVVGVEGAVGVRPDSLDVSADGVLEDVSWDRWDDRGAEGTGTLKVRDCDPSCASGGRDAYVATIRLSEPRLCGRATYFDRASVELDGAPGSAGRAGPTTYVRAPC